MPLCGFNEKMLKGLTAFNEGLVEHGLIFRAKKNGETIDQAIKRELSDMIRLLAETHKIDNSAKRILTEGIIKYAMGFYLIMRSQKVDNYKEVVESIGSYFHSMDDKYYSELEGKSEDMEELIKFLNSIELKPNMVPTTGEE